MMNWSNRYFLYFMLIVIVLSCKKPYLPALISSSASFVVVEGVINSGSDSTIIKLSRTANLADKKTANPLSGATLTVESDQNSSYQLVENTPGSYVSPGLNLDNSKKYRLRIRTPDNQQYLSDFVVVINSPPLDSVNFKITNNGLNFYSNTHDPKNSTRYYRWDFQETWVFHANYPSYFKSDGTTVLPRDLNNDNIYECWGNNNSSSIILGSSAKLSQDVITDNPITFIDASSEKIGIKYSILVKQYALTKDAFAFWENLKKNTEQLGSIFDAQPSQSNGNIHSVSNLHDPVVGYISVGSTTSKRIFITNRQLPAWATTRTYPECTLDTFLYKYIPPGSKTPINQVDLYINGKNPSILPVTQLGVPGSPPIGFSGSTSHCVDCTLRGTNKQPVFWK